MAKQDDLQAAFDAIKAATDRQGVVLTDEAASLQKISDGIAALITAAKNGTLTDAEVASAQALATATSAIGDSMVAQAAFAKSIASSLAVPVPVPVPPVTPITV